MSTKGCVYFMQVKGLHPIKIGMTGSPTPYHRCSQIGKIAPFGYEVIGYISSLDYVELEMYIHKELSSNRLSGEWFDVSIFDCAAIIAKHNGVLLAGTGRSSHKRTAASYRANKDLPLKTKNAVRDAYNDDPKFSRKTLASALGITDRAVRKHVSDLKSKGYV
jgi:hypothetical protein